MSEYFIISNEEFEKMLSIMKSENLSDELKARKCEEIVPFIDYIKYMEYRRINKFILSDISKEVEEIYCEYEKQGLVDYNREYKCTNTELRKSIENLKKAYEIANSDKEDLEKADVIFNIYDNYDTFKMKTEFLIASAKRDENLSEIANIAADFRNFKKEVSRLSKSCRSKITAIKNRKQFEKLLEEKSYLEDYEYAEYAVMAYYDKYCLDLDREFISPVVLRKMGLDYSSFEYCKELVKILNPVLYRKYMDEQAKATEIREKQETENLMDLAQGIETGYLPDGTPFDRLMFYVKNPYRTCNEKDMFKCLKSLSDVTAQSIIKQYVHNNKFSGSCYRSEEDMIRIYKKTTTSINGIEVTPEVVHNTYRYINACNFPPLDSIFTILLNKYMRGEITLDDIEKMEEKNDVEEVYKNPYKLIRR